MGAYTGLLPSSPTQPCLTWYAASPHITLNCRTLKTMHLCAGRNADGFHRGGRGGVGQSGAGNRRRSRVRNRGDARQARDRQSGALQAASSPARARRCRGRLRALHPLLCRCVRSRQRGLGRSGQFYAVALVRRRLRAQLDGQFVRVFAGAERDGVDRAARRRRP